MCVYIYIRITNICIYTHMYMCTLVQSLSVLEKSKSKI